MKKSAYNTCVVAVVLAGLLTGVSAKAADEEVKKGEARFAIGLTYASGVSDVNDFITETFELSGYEVDDLVIPVGLSLVGGYRFANGVEILIDAGPVSLVYVDATGGMLDGEYTYWDVPVGLTGGYAFLTDRAVSPYVRGGFRHHFAGGDFYDSSTPGLYIAGGLNFFSNKAMQLQLEVAYDTSEVSLVDDVAGTGRSEDVEPGAFMASIRAAF